MEVTIKRSMRKTLSLQVKNGQIIVKAPIFVSKKQVFTFIEKNKNWIESKIYKQNQSLIIPEKIPEYKLQAKKYIPERVKILAEKFWFQYNSVKITSAKTRWWSCTSKKNLNFSYRLILTPTEIIDYVICHELAHLKHMNHSRQFWNEVSRMDKNYKKNDSWLKVNADLFH